MPFPLFMLAFVLMNKWPVVLLLLSLSFSAKAALKPFFSDYCTWYPEGTIHRPQLWKHCCLEHDLYYWIGGNRNDRWRVDQLLKQCVQQTNASRAANIMYQAVRIGSLSPFKMRGRKWGHGWHKRRRYQSLTISEIQLIFDYLTKPNRYVTPELIQSVRAELLRRAGDDF
jgi:hypothetical protein